MKYMFMEYDVQKIYANAVTVNEPSIHILQKLGMNQVGVSIGGFQKGEVVLDLYNFCISGNEGY